MTALRDALKAIRAPRRLSVPSEARVARAADRIDQSAVGIAKPNAAKDYNAIARSLLICLRDGRAWTLGDLRDSAWCLWKTIPALAGSVEGLKAVLEGIDAADRKQPYRALVSSFVASFDRSLPGMDEVSNLLARKAVAIGMPWSELHSSLRFFDLDEGPEAIARHALESRVSPTAVLISQGLSAFDGQSGYAKACVRAALLRLAQQDGHDSIARLEMVSALALDERGQLIFTEDGPLVADALIRPFGDSTPGKSVRDRFLSVLLALFGDPRLNPGRWVRMREIEIVVRRWLTEQTLRQFLDVVDIITDRADAEHMWKYRRAFWEAVYQADLIQEAWVVSIRRVREKQNDHLERM